MTKKRLQSRVVRLSAMITNYEDKDQMIALHHNHDTIPTQLLG